MQPYFAWNELEEISQYYVRFSYKNLERLGVKQDNYRQTKKSYRGVVGDPAKIYRLYMILKDAAGNISKLKILLRYKNINYE